MAPTGPDVHFSLDHEIFVLDAYIRRPIGASERDGCVRKLVNALLTALRMDELGPLQIYPAVDLRAPGWSFLQPITTSHVSGHYFEGQGKFPQIHMDFYSCAGVNWRKILEIVHKHLSLRQWHATFIRRHIDESPRTTLRIFGEGDTILDEVDLLEPQKHLVSVRGKRGKLLTAV